VLQKKRERLRSVQQALHVADEPADLHREQEVVRRLLPPAREMLARGQAIEGIVQLDCAEAGPVPGELLARAQTRRVEDAAAPVPVDVARCADPHLRHGRFSPRARRLPLWPSATETRSGAGLQASAPPRSRAARRRAARRRTPGSSRPRRAGRPAGTPDRRPHSTSAPPEPRHRASRRGSGPKSRLPAALGIVGERGKQCGRKCGGG